MNNIHQLQRIEANPLYYFWCMSLQRFLMVEGSGSGIRNKLIQQMYLTSIDIIDDLENNSFANCVHPVSFVCKEQKPTNGDFPFLIAQITEKTECVWLQACLDPVAKMMTSSMFTFSKSLFFCVVFIIKQAKATSRFRFISYQLGNVRKQLLFLNIPAKIFAIIHISTLSFIYLFLIQSLQIGGDCALNTQIWVTCPVLKPGVGPDPEIHCYEQRM